MVITNVDYCSSTLAGISGALFQRLQSVLNVAAPLMLSAKRSEHVTPLLRQLCTLVKSSGVSFVLMHRSLPPWHCATVPCWDTSVSVDGWCTRTSSSPVCFDVDTRRTTDTSSHHWWSRVSGCCVPCLEFSSNFGQGNPVTACVPLEIEDSIVCHLFSGKLTVI